MKYIEEHEQGGGVTRFRGGSYFIERIGKESWLVVQSPKHVTPQLPIDYEFEITTLKVQKLPNEDLLIRVKLK